MRRGGGAPTLLRVEIAPAEPDADAAVADVLAPYVPRLVVDWLLDEPDRVHRTVDGSYVFADISGFTALTERLAVRGRAGAEEIADVLNAVFDRLLTAAYDYGANLIKFGGDAVLLLFDGTDHALCATRAARSMQQVMSSIGRLQTSQGVVRLGMSVGVHTGALDLLLVGSHHRELIVTGPGATLTAHLEKIAERGQIVVSTATAALLPASCVGTAVDDGFLLARSPMVEERPNRTPKRRVDVREAMSAEVSEYLSSGHVDHEHRRTVVGFLEFCGVDDLLAEHGAAELADAVAFVVDAVQEAAAANEVTLLASDLAEDGGKLILTSGVPRSAGDDETRLLSTMRRVVHPGGRLALRAGITSGRVFAGDYGPFYRKTYSIVGDAVNLAARLMTRAQPGQIIATAAVSRASRTPFTTTVLPPFTVKGKREPIEAVVVGDLLRTSAPAVADRLPLVGRGEELAILRAAADQAAAGRGAVVELIGAAGMGKSRLLEELTDHTDARVLWADGDVYGRATPYQPMQRMLRRTLGLPDDVEQATLAAALVDLVRGSAPDLARWLPLIGIVAGVDLPTTPEVDALDADVRRARLESVTSDLLGRLLTMPIVMIFNDVHFMDDATAGFALRLAADAPSRPWLLILTRRGVDEAEVAVGPHVHLVELTPLDGAAVGELLGLATDTNPLPAHRMRQLSERAGGNPLFLTRLVGAAAEAGDFDELPDSVEATIAAQIDRLPARRRRWLRAASVLGMSFEPAMLDAILAGTDLADESATGLEEFIAPSVDSQLRFVHHLVQLSAYEGLSYRRRRELHARAAMHLEAVGDRRREQHAALLSLHNLHGERYEAAWHYSKLAGDHARDQYAPSEAADCYRRAQAAAAHLPALSDDEVVDMFEALAAVSMDLGETDEAEHALRHARTRARSDPLRLARLHLETARHRQHVGRHADALRWISRGRSLLRCAQDGPSLRLRAQLAERSASVRYDQGAYRTGIGWARRAVDEARQAGDLETEARGLGLGAVLAAVGGGAAEDEMLRRSLELYEQIGDLRGKARAANVFGMCAYFAGQWDVAVGYYAQAEQASRQIGRDFDAAAAAANRAEILVQQGHIEAAGPVLAATVPVLRAARATSFLGFALTIAGRLDLARGAYGDASDRLGDARSLCAEMGEVDEILTIDALVADCHLRAGKFDEALAGATATTERMVRDTASAAPLAHRVRGEALIGLGQFTDGAAELRTALVAARHRRADYEVVATLQALLRCRVATDENERRTWIDEAQELSASLGIVSPG